MNAAGDTGHQRLGNDSHGDDAGGGLYLLELSLEDELSIHHLKAGRDWLLPIGTGRARPLGRDSHGSRRLLRMTLLESRLALNLLWLG